MSMQFPASPAVGQTFSPTAGVVYRWSGLAWYLITPGALSSSLLGQPNGVASLDGAGQVPASQLGNVVTTLPTRTVLTAGAGTYTTPVGARQLRTRMVGGGSGGGGGNNTALASNAPDTTFGTLVAGGARGGNVSNPGLGGVPIGGDVNLKGGLGSQGEYSASGVAGASGGSGAASVFGGSGCGSYNGAGLPALPNTGAGGGGGGIGSSSVLSSAAGGSAGGYLEKIIDTPAASYSYSVASASPAQVGGVDGFTGGNGGSGIIIIDEFY